MADATPQPVVQAWLIRLGLRCAPTKGQEDNALRVVEYVPGLAASLPSRAFCDASLEAVSARFEFFPAYAVLRKALEKWLDDNKSRVLALPGVPENLPATDRCLIAAWNATRSGTRPLAAGVTLKTHLDILRKPAPAAFAYLLRTDDVARGIAEEAGWVRVHDEADAAPAPGPVGAVAAAVRAPPLYAASAPAPATDAAAVAAADKGFVAAFAAKHGGRSPGALSEDLLAKRREEAGIKFPAVKPKPRGGAKPFVPRPANDPALLPDPPDCDPSGPFAWSA